MTPDKNKNYYFTDSHAHLTTKKFQRDRDKVLQFAYEDNVKLVINVVAEGSLESFHRALNFSDKHNLPTVLGFHPHEARKVEDPMFDDLVRLSEHPNVVAIGETGLDYHYMFSPKETQEQVFRRTVGIARELKFPLVIHTREADDDCARILKEEKAYEAGGVIHCFSSTEKLAEQCLEMGFVLSFSGIITYRSTKSLANVVRKTPLEKMMIETDSPYLAPIPRRGRRNEPAFVRFVAERIAEIKKVPIEEVARKTTETAIQLFGLERFLKAN